MGLWLRTLLAVAYNFGWRKSELLGLRIRQIDLAARTIRLEVGETKNGAGRLIKMSDEVFTLMSACIAGKEGRTNTCSRRRQQGAGFSQGLAECLQTRWRAGTVSSRSPSHWRAESSSARRC